MAKQKSEIPDSSNNIFKELILQHNQVSPQSAVKATDMYSKIKMFIPTGSLILDTIISNKKEEGGWPVGRIIEVYGAESTGKSTLAYQAMVNTQKMGGVCIFIDAEQAGSLEMMRNCGVDTEKVIYSRLSILEEIFEALESNLKYIISVKELKDKPVFICLDSIAAIMVQDEEEGTFEYNMNIATKKAVLIGKALRKITPLLGKANAVLYCVNQTRDKIGITFGDPTTTPGGKALRFYASIRIRLSGKTPIIMPDPYMEQMYNEALDNFEQQLEEWKLNGKREGQKPEKPLKKDFKGDDILVGYDVTARTDKNKIAPPHREADFRLLFAEGVVDEQSWMNYGIKFGAIKEGKRGEFQVEGDDTIFSRKEWLETVSDTKIHTKIKNVIIDNLVRASNSSAMKEIEKLSDITDLVEEDEDISEPEAK